MLNAADIAHVYTGLMALKELVKIYQWTPVAKRAPLYQIIDTTFPMLLTTASKLINQDTREAGEMIKIIVKIYCCSIRLDISKTQQSSNFLVPWCTLLIQVIDKPIHEQMMPADLEEREKYCWWKAKVTFSFNI